MPRLLLFVPCKQAITGLEDRLVTPVSVLESVLAVVPPGTPVPANASIAMPWAIVTTWYSEPGDAGKHVEQRVQVVMPDGQLASEITAEFELAKRMHRHTAHIEGFNISQVGEHWLRLALREGDQDWRLFAEYPIMVVHVTVEVELEVQAPTGVTVTGGEEFEIPGGWAPGEPLPRPPRRPTRGTAATPPRSQRKKKR